MRYWTGLLIAVAFDAAVIAGPVVVGTEPQPARSQAIQWPAASEPESLSIVRLQELDQRVESLLDHLHEHTDDVDAMLAVARLYAENGWAGEAIGPLARALQLDPYRRDLRIRSSAAGIVGSSSLDTSNNN